MNTKVKLDATYVPSEDLVTREIEGELIIVPLTSGIADLEDEIYTLNETGKVIWNKLDGKRNLEELIEDISQVYDVSLEEIKGDVMGLIEELLKRRMLVEAPVD